MNHHATRLDQPALRESLRLLFGLSSGQLVPADEVASPPAGLYLTLREQASREVGQSRSVFSGANQRERIFTSCETSFRLTGYGAGALELLRDARSLLQSSRARDGLRGLRAALLRMGLLENQSAVSDGLAFEQAWIELVISHEHIVDIEQKPIASATVSARSESGLVATATIHQTET